ncbi:hypothetical protein [Vallitalea okinawensis]|uniref:hypothetical protein n=1 Tax=Vallitalea okinawensis TaxID=2078660 RepID=UPI000CFB7A99|nr:hypothetical protein [Vallitalea okinawensis]
MKEKGCIEIITFKLIDHVKDQQAFDGFKVLDEFQKKSAGSGYYGMDIAKVGEGQWTLVIHWQSKELEKEVSSKMLKSDETKSFKMLINNKTVVKNVYPYY